MLADDEGKHAEERLRRFIAGLGQRLHPSMVDDVVHLLNYGERKIALEIFCDLLAEDQVVLAVKEGEDLFALIEALGLDKAYRKGLIVSPAPEGPEDP